MQIQSWFTCYLLQRQVTSASESLRGEVSCSMHWLYIITYITKLSMFDVFRSQFTCGNEMVSVTVKNMVFCDLELVTSECYHTYSSRRCFNRCIYTFNGCCLIAMQHILAVISVLCVQESVTCNICLFECTDISSWFIMHVSYTGME